MNTNIFSTRNEAIYRLIVEPIDASGEASAADYDVDAIADEILIFNDADRLDAQGWVLKPEYDGEDGVEAFWSVVENNER